MKHHFISIACGGFLLMGMLSGCGGQKETSLVNTLTFDAKTFESLRLDYDADDIRVLESDNDKVMIKEYMNQDKKSYYARIAAQNGECLVTEGARPWRSDFEAYIELYIPKLYTGSLSLHSTSGTILSDAALNLSGDFRVDTTSGVIKISNAQASSVSASSTNGSLSFENIYADEINLQTTHAATTAKQVKGNLLYESKGGTLTASQLYGSGSFSASGEGSLDISFAEVSGNLYAYSKNGNIILTLPNELEFKFIASTKEGSVETSFSDRLAVTDTAAAGTVGDSPYITVELETKNGDITVLR